MKLVVLEGGSQSNGRGTKSEKSPIGFDQKLILADGIGLDKGAKLHLKKEHCKWEDRLIKMIKTGSRIKVSADGCVEHILPPSIVKLVFQSMIEQRIALEEQGGLDRSEAENAALIILRGEVDEAVALAQAAKLLQRVRDEGK